MKICTLTKNSQVSVCLHHMCTVWWAETQILCPYMITNLAGRMPDWCSNCESSEDPVKSNNPYQLCVYNLSKPYTVQGMSEIQKLVKQRELSYIDLNINYLSFLLGSVYRLLNHIISNSLNAGRIFFCGFSWIFHLKVTLLLKNTKIVLSCDEILFFSNFT